MSPQQRDEKWTRRVGHGCGEEGEAGRGEIAPSGPFELELEASPRISQREKRRKIKNKNKKIREDP